MNDAAVPSKNAARNCTYKYHPVSQSNTVPIVVRTMTVDAEWIPVYCTVGFMNISIKDKVDSLMEMKIAIHCSK